MSTRILVVDDDPGISEMVSILLESEGYDVGVCATGTAALPAFRSQRPDLILLDVMLPGLDGVSVCEQIREESDDVPIIMMSARTTVLLARVKARLRRQEPEVEVLRVADIAIDLKAHQATRDGKPLHLTPLEFELLSVLARKPSQVFSREELLDQVWGYRQSSHDPRVVNVHIQRLRAKVEIDPDNPEVILTVRGVGYRAGAVQE